jgi:hypothetical protein
MESQRTPRIGRLAAALACLLVVALTGPELAGASPQSKLTPLVTCVDLNTDGTITAHWGYTNTWPNQINVPVGNRPGQVNYFSPDPQDRGQPTKFSSGTFNNVFTVTFTGTLTWFLDDANGTPNSATASSSSTQCAPVPAFGIDSPLPVIVLTLAIGLVLAARRRAVAQVRP